MLSCFFSAWVSLLVDHLDPRASNYITPKDQHRDEFLGSRSGPEISSSLLLVSEKSIYNLICQCLSCSCSTMRCRKPSDIPAAHVIPHNRVISFSSHAHNITHYAYEEDMVSLLPLPHALITRGDRILVCRIPLQCKSADGMRMFSSKLVFPTPGLGAWLDPSTQMAMSSVILRVS